MNAEALAIQATPRADQSASSPWIWVPLGVLLATRIEYVADFMDEEAYFSFEADYFLPLLTGWLATKFGFRALGPIALLGLLALIRIPIDIWESAQVIIGFSASAYFLSVCAGLAFSFRRPLSLLTDFLAPTWRLTLWLTLCVLTWNAYAGKQLTITFDDAASLYWDPAVILSLALLGPAFQWRRVVAALGLPYRDAWIRSRRNTFTAITLGAVLATVVLANFTYYKSTDGDWFQFWLGLFTAEPLLVTLAFSLTAWGIIDWRWMIGLLIAVFLGEILWSHPWISPEHLSGASTSRMSLKELALSGWGHDLGPGRIVLIDSVCAALLGSTVSPLWRSMEIEPLKGRRTTIMLIMIFALQFFGEAGGSEGYFGLEDSSVLVLGGVAFVAGLKWGGKGVIVVPLCAQLSLLMCFTVVRDYMTATQVWDLAALGATTFIFALFGMLSNRYEVNADRRARANWPRKEERGPITIVDITTLGTVIRRLDISAVIKSFVAVLAPIVLLWTLISIPAAIVQFLELEPWLSENSLYEDLPMLRTVIIAAVLSAFAPLSFVFFDWAARRQSWRHVSAISAAGIGALGYAALGLLIGSIAYVLEEVEGVILGASIVCLLVLVTWLLGRSRLARAVLLGFVVLVAAWLVTGFGAVLWMLVEEMEFHPDEGGVAGVLQVLGIFLLVGLVVWWLVRAVRLRLFMSRDLPRTLLLGELHRQGLWPRLAFLTGLPSSLWNRAALSTSAFWVIVASRPLVYLGLALLFNDASMQELGGAVIIPVALALVVGGHFAFHFGKRLATKYVRTLQDLGDPRPPILFLRSFEDDQFDFKRARWDVVGRWFDLWSFRRNADEALIDEMAQYGPVVALGRPGEKDAPFGAARTYATHESWRATITDIAKRAQSIVIAAGDSPGVLWEYEMLRGEGLLSRTLLLFQPTRQADASNRRALEALATTTREGLRIEISDGRRMIALLQTPGVPALLVARRAPCAVYVGAMRAHFQKFGAPHLLEIAH